jgi:hypothetical protein
LRLEREKKCPRRGEKGDARSADVKRGWYGGNFTHERLSRAVKRPFSFMPVTVTARNVLVRQIKPFS